MPRKPLFAHGEDNPRDRKVPARKGPPPSAHDLRCASVLARALVKHQWTTKAPQLTRWAQSFRALRTAAGVPDAEVRRVLFWYCAHLLDQYTPKARSAESFREKFPAIRDAAARAEQDNPSVVITPVALAVCRALAALKWPGDTAARLPLFIQLSLDRYGAFAGAVERLRSDDDRDLARVAAVVGRHLTKPDHFVKQWWVDHFPLVKKYPNVRLAGVAFAPGHKDFHALGRAWVQDYCGRPVLWDKLVTEATK